MSGFHQTAKLGGLTRSDILCPTPMDENRLAGRGNLIAIGTRIAPGFRIGRLTAIGFLSPPNMYRHTVQLVGEPVNLLLLVEMTLLLPGEGKVFDA